MSEKVLIKNQEVDFVQQLLADYKVACISRETSLLGRKEVLTGKAKFGIFGDGKELAQIALSKFFNHGDFRSGYYRDQTLMFALDLMDVKQYFAGIYAHADIKHEPMSGGRQMGGHFATWSLNEDGSWKALKEQYNVSSDISPTAGQMPRLLGLAQASKIYRHNELLANNQFSEKGNEVAFGTIGDASTSEGLFWESLNAASVLQVPMVMSVWDDGYGISVPKRLQTTKSDISDALAGFQRNSDQPNGFEIMKVKGWDYPALIATYEKAVAFARAEHVPVLVHVVEITQPQGHSTSGSHERYKDEKRLAWETEFDCIEKFKSFILSINEGDDNVSEAILEDIRKTAKKEVREMQKQAWNEFSGELLKERDEAVAELQKLAAVSSQKVFIEKQISALAGITAPIRKDIFSCFRAIFRLTRDEKALDERQALVAYYETSKNKVQDKYSLHLLSETEASPMNIKEVAPIFSDELVDGRLVLRDNFKVLFERHPELLTFGEDTGKIGGVNQSMEGMQEQFGELRVSDTGIREASILGQGIGMAMRGLRPIAEIQYLDYILYALQIMSDDLATVRYRTFGKQKAPLIVRTRGHRLEGIWHSGSPMAGIINLVRGMHVCVPRNMVTAAGMYNTLIKGDDPAIVIEPLNGYRIKEKLPTNLGDYTVELGVPEVVAEGADVTIVSYGSTCNLAEKALQPLRELGVNAELIDIRTLLPFDKNHSIAESLKKTNRLVVLDEDVSGGASAYMLDKILVEQKAYFHLDSEPVTISAQDHRPAYGTDGDYFSKPSIDDMVEKIYSLMNEAKPAQFPSIY
jgi:pyruvate/2-oxoglutarate/acetoin dehydrogenase E1 component/TPP-dependent pyruvate/acetoin dehydrogenase alpha subunit